MGVITEIKAERERQVSEEQWSPEHDDSQVKGEMAAAAAAYALLASHPGYDRHKFYWRADWWPWAANWWKPKNRRRDLVRAAALIVAEIERLDRATIQRMASKLEASGTQIDPDMYGRLK